MSQDHKEILTLETTIRMAIEKIRLKPTMAVILGSGWGAQIQDLMEVDQVLPYQEIPPWPVPKVKGHAGELVCGKISGREVLLLKGRAHYYEGFSHEELAFPMKVLQALGIKTLLLTNSAGGIKEDFEVGDLVSITDHIGLFHHNPLVGPHFIDMSNAYNSNLREYLADAAKKAGVKLKEGIYAAVTGPSYETPAEIRMLRTLGADMVGMSTVSECILANQMGIKVCAISCITNKAADLSGTKLSHSEVTEAAAKSAKKFSTLLQHFIQLCD